MPPCELEGSCRDDSGDREALLRSSQEFEGSLTRSAAGSTERADLLLSLAERYRDLGEIDGARFRARAIAVLRDFIRDYPEHTRLDYALFMLGRRLLASNQPRESRTVFRDLISRFPQSTYVGPAYMDFGDYLFGQSEFRSSRPFYEMALSAAHGFQPHLVPLILYRLAWNLRRMSPEAEAEVREIFGSALASLPDNRAGGRAGSIETAIRTDVCRSAQAAATPTAVGTDR
jgi:TolA-binding protein